MKPLAFVLLGLVGSLILTNIPISSYADPQLDSLLRIASQARDNIHIQLSQLSTIPDEINQLYNQGSQETDALSQSISKNDASASKGHFLSAMKIFKEISDKISSITTNEQPSQVDTLPLIGEINRLQKLGDSLRTISKNNNVKMDFTKFDGLMQDARQNLVSGNLDQVKQDLKTSNQFLLDARHTLADVANQKTTDRAKDFTNKQIERLSQVNTQATSQNVTQATSQNVTQAVSPKKPLPETTNSIQTESISDMITKLKQLVSDGKIDEALKLLKTIESLQSQKETSQVSSPETSNSTQPDNTNNNNTPEITNSNNNPTSNSGNSTSPNSGNPTSNSGNSTSPNSGNPTSNSGNSTSPNSGNPTSNSGNSITKQDIPKQPNTVNSTSSSQTKVSTENPTHNDIKKKLQENKPKINSDSKDHKKTKTDN